jgi:hypothetical protein
MINQGNCGSGGGRSVTTWHCKLVPTCTACGADSAFVGGDRAFFLLIKGATSAQQAGEGEDTLETRALCIANKGKL